MNKLGTIKKKYGESLIERIVLFEIGLFFTSIPAFAVIHFYESIPMWGHLLLFMAFSFGAYSILCSIFSKEKWAEKLAELTGNHEIVVVFIILAIPISWIINRVFSLDNEHA